MNPLDWHGDHFAAECDGTCKQPAGDSVNYHYIANQGKSAWGADVIAQIMQEVNDLPPWAYTYKERPDDLLEVRASELEAILQATLSETDGISPTEPTEIERLEVLAIENERLATALDMVAEEREAWKTEAMRLRALYATNDAS